MKKLNKILVSKLSKSPSLSHDQYHAMVGNCCGVKFPKEQHMSPTIQVLVKMIGHSLSYSVTILT